MITNPQCEAEEKKFNPGTFEDDLPELNGGGGGGTDSASQPILQPSQHIQDMSYCYGGGGGYNVGEVGGYPPRAGDVYGTGYGGRGDVGGYGSRGEGGFGGYQGYGWQDYPQYYNQYYQYPPQNLYQDQWQSPTNQVHPPGPSPTGSNNSPSPHAFSDNNEDTTNPRTDLKRPSPESFNHLTTLTSQPPMGQQPPPAKKPKVSKRRKKRDPNEPQKPVSAYALFFRDTQASIKIRNPNANFGEVSKIVAATWDALDPDNKAAYKKRTEIAKKEYLRALAAYRANMVSKGSGHELYGGYPGYSNLLVGTPGLEQNMPPSGMMGGMMYPGNGGFSHGYNSSPLQMSTPPQISNQISSGHPSPSQLSGGHQTPSSHPSAGQLTPGHSSAGQLTPGHSSAGQLTPGHQSGGGQPTPPQDSETGQDDRTGRSDQPQRQVYQTTQHNQDLQVPRSFVDNSVRTGFPGRPEYPESYRYNAGQYSVNANSGKCARPGCSRYSGPQSNNTQTMAQEFCSSECVMGECKEVYNTWTSCMVKQGTSGGQQDILQAGQTGTSDLLVK